MSNTLMSNTHQTVAERFLSIRKAAINSTSHVADKYESLGQSSVPLEAKLKILADPALLPYFTSDRTPDNLGGLALYFLTTYGKQLPQKFYSLVLGWADDSANLALLDFQHTPASACSAIAKRVMAQGVENTDPELLEALLQDRRVPKSLQVKLRDLIEEDDRNTLRVLGRDPKDY